MRNSLLRFCVCLSLGLSSYAQAEKVRSASYASMHFGLLEIGVEGGWIENENTSYFLILEAEGFPLAGRWENVFVGIQKALPRHMYYRVGAGVQSTTNFAGRYYEGPAITSYLGWQWDYEKTFFQFSLTGLTIRYDSSPNDLGFVLHVPSLAFGYRF